MLDKDLEELRRRDEEISQLLQTEDNTHFLQVGWLKREDMREAMGNRETRNRYKANLRQINICVCMEKIVPKTYCIRENFQRNWEHTAHFGVFFGHDLSLFVVTFETRISLLFATIQWIHSEYLKYLVAFYFWNHCSWLVGNAETQLDKADKCIKFSYITTLIPKMTKRTVTLLTANYSAKWLNMSYQMSTC